MATRITKIKEKQEDGNFIEYPIGVRGQDVYLEENNKSLDEKLQEVQDELNKIYWIED